MLLHRFQLMLMGLKWSDKGPESTSLCEKRETQWPLGTTVINYKGTDICKVATSTTRKEDLLYIFKSYRHLNHGVL